MSDTELPPTEKEDQSVESAAKEHYPLWEPPPLDVTVEYGGYPPPEELPVLEPDGFKTRKEPSREAVNVENPPHDVHPEVEQEHNVRDPIVQEEESRDSVPTPRPVLDIAACEKFFEDIAENEASSDAVNGSRAREVAEKANDQSKAVAEESVTMTADRGSAVVAEAAAPTDADIGQQVSNDNVEYAQSNVTKVYDVTSLVFDKEDGGYKYYKHAEELFAEDTHGNWFLLGSRGEFEPFDWSAHAQGQSQQDMYFNANYSMSERAMRHAHLPYPTADLMKYHCSANAVQYDEFNRAVYPVNEVGWPILPLNRKGVMAFPVDQTGMPVFPFNAYGDGEPCLPLNEYNRPVFPVVRYGPLEGKAIVPVDSKGYPTYYRHPDGSFAYPAYNDGTPFPACTMYGNPVAAYDEYGQPWFPKNAEGEALIALGTDGHAYSIAEYRRLFPPQEAMSEAQWVPPVQPPPPPTDTSTANREREPDQDEVFTVPPIEEQLAARATAAAASELDELLDISEGGGGGGEESATPEHQPRQLENFLDAKKLEAELERQRKEKEDEVKRKKEKEREVAELELKERERRDTELKKRRMASQLRFMKKLDPSQIPAAAAPVGSSIAPSSPQFIPPPQLPPSPVQVQEESPQEEAIAKESENKENDGSAHSLVAQRDEYETIASDGEIQVLDESTTEKSLAVKAETAEKELRERLERKRRTKRSGDHDAVGVERSRGRTSRTEGSVSRRSYERRDTDDEHRRSTRRRSRRNRSRSRTPEKRLERRTVSRSRSRSRRRQSRSYVENSGEDDVDRTERRRSKKGKKEKKKKHRKDRKRERQNSRSRSRSHSVSNDVPSRWNNDDDDGDHEGSEVVALSPVPVQQRELENFERIAAQRAYETPPSMYSNHREEDMDVDDPGVGEAGSDDKISPDSPTPERFSKELADRDTSTSSGKKLSEENENPDVENEHDENERVLTPVPVEYAGIPEPEHQKWNPRPIRLDLHGDEAPQHFDAREPPRPMRQSTPRSPRQGSSTVEKQTRDVQTEFPEDEELVSLRNLMLGEKLIGQMRAERKRITKERKKCEAALLRARVLFHAEQSSTDSEEYPMRDSVLFVNTSRSRTRSIAGGASASTASWQGMRQETHSPDVLSRKSDAELLEELSKRCPANEELLEHIRMIRELTAQKDKSRMVYVNPDRLQQRPDGR